MKLAKLLNEMTMPQLETVRLLSNLSAEENEIFDLLAKGESIIYIADKLNISPSTVSNRIKVIKAKILKVVNMVDI